MAIEERKKLICLKDFNFQTYEQGKSEWGFILGQRIEADLISFFKFNLYT
jgi:hypothetical protein